MARPPTQLRAKILDCALQLLKERGERALTQTAVAKAAGLPQGHLTYYFPKKRDLILGVAEHFAAVTATDMQAFFQQRAQLPRQEVMRAYVGQLAADRSRTRMLLGLLVISDEVPELADMLERNAAVLRGLLAAAIGRQLEDPTVDLMLALLWGLGIHDFVLRSGRTEALLTRALASFSAETAEAGPDAAK